MRPWWKGVVHLRRTKKYAFDLGYCLHIFIRFNSFMSLTAKTKSRSKDADRYRQSVATEVLHGVRESRATDRLAAQGRRSLGLRGAPKKPIQQKTRLATFSFTPEDLRYVEKATYQVIQALETGVSKSHTVRLAMRAFASMSVEELRTLLNRVSIPTLTP